MYPPIFATATASLDVTQKLGSNPTRFYLFGQAAQNTAKPYGVWQLISGSPYNQLKGVPGMDRYTVQVDVYATTVTAAREAAEALRDAFEPVAYVVGWRGESRDTATQHYRVGFDIDWHVPRPDQS